MSPLFGTLWYVISKPFLDKWLSDLKRIKTWFPEDRWFGGKMYPQYLPSNGKFADPPS